MLRDPPRGVSSLKHILGSQTVKSHTEGWMLLTGLKNQWVWHQGCKKLRLHPWHAGTCFLTPETMPRKQTDCWELWTSFHEHPSEYPSPSRISALAPLAPQYRSKEGQRLSQPRRMCNYRVWRQLIHGIACKHGKGSHHWHSQKDRRLVWRSDWCWE